MQQKLFHSEKISNLKFSHHSQNNLPLYFLKDNFFKQLNFILSWDFGEI